jgi:hypothetical protein
MADGLSCMRRCLKTMKHVAAVGEEEADLVWKKTAILSFAIMAIELDIKIWVQVFGVYDDYFLKNNSSFSFFQASDFSCSSRCAEEVGRLNQISCSPHAFFYPLWYNNWLADHQS